MEFLYEILDRAKMKKSDNVHRDITVTVNSCHV